MHYPGARCKTTTATGSGSAPRTRLCLGLCLLHRNVSPGQGVDVRIRLQTHTYVPRARVPQTGFPGDGKDIPAHAVEWCDGVFFRVNEFVWFS